MNWNFPYASRRMPLLAANCVATTQPLAAQAGLSMLQRGGSAADAAIATAIALIVVEPVNNGIGSDLFAMVWEGGPLAGLNASGRSPAAWTPDRFTDLEMPDVGWNTATVPGAVAGWVALHQRFGRLPFETLFEPAIRYARDGFQVSPIIALIWERQVERLGGQPGFAETFLPHGRAPTPGELFRSVDLARTLEAIGATRGEALYRGVLADRIEAAALRDGGLMKAADLAAHRCDWVEPLDVTFCGHRVHELPPNGQGIAALIALGVLERCGIDGLAPDDPEMLHLQIEALKVGVFDVRTHVADPEHMRVEAASLLDPARLDELAAGIRRGAAAPMRNAQRAASTVYLSAADSAGMMVSLIQSNYHGFGSGVVVPGTGIALNNRGSGFVTERDHPNCVGPSKRPLNTIIPGFITKDGEAVAAFGLMGGTMQPQGHLQVVSRMLASGQNPQTAIDAPRWRCEDGETWVEGEMPEDARSGLAARGHRLVEGTFLDFGASQIIRRTAHGYVAASESRRDGCAVGF